MDRQDRKMLAIALVLAAVWPLYSALCGLTGRPVVWQGHLVTGLVFLFLALTIYFDKI